MGFTTNSLKAILNDCQLLFDGRQLSRFVESVYGAPVPFWCWNRTIPGVPGQQHSCHSIHYVLSTGHWVPRRNIPCTHIILVSRYDSKCKHSFMAKGICTARVSPSNTKPVDIQDTDLFLQMSQYLSVLGRLQVCRFSQVHSCLFHGNFKPLMISNTFSMIKWNLPWSRATSAVEY